MVGIGPGGLDHLTPAAGTALAEAEVIVGYKTYLELIQELIAHKEVVVSSMMKEVDRCGQALDLATSGRRVALVCGGDPGIYAMAGLVYDLAVKRDLEVDIEVVPGVAALNACAARLGAPLMHDFAVISLSDLLTPWALIEKRLAAAAMADFVLVLYNPRSRKRTSQIERARELILERQRADTPVGIVTAATRKEECVVLTDLASMLEHEIGMQSLVIIGNSQTYVDHGRMITPRGYGDKYRLA